MITEQQYQQAAELLGVDTASIKAVKQVESRGSGFLSDKSVTILFEPHIFWQELQREGKDPFKFLPQNADILYPNQKPGAYGKYSEQWPKLERAMRINIPAAYRSASWGLFQILGKYYHETGCKTIQEFVDSMKKDEGEHLILFCNLIKHRGLDSALRRKDWATFARYYNGAAYRQNKYDEKLASAYNSFSVPNEDSHKKA